MGSTDIERVRASFRRCNADCEFIDHFYQRFMESSPEVTAKFAAVDMDHQAVMMRASLELLLRHAPRRTELAPLVELHSRRGVDIPPRLYQCWLDSLLGTVKAHDPQCDDALLGAWRRVLLPGIGLMSEGY